MKTDGADGINEKTGSDRWQNGRSATILIADTQGHAPQRTPHGLPVLVAATGALVQTRPQDSRFRPFPRHRGETRAVTAIPASGGPSSAPAAPPRRTRMAARVPDGTRMVN